MLTENGGLTTPRFFQTQTLDAVGLAFPAVEADPSSIKAKVAGLLNATRYLRMPLTLLNVVAVVFELLLG